MRTRLDRSTEHFERLVNLGVAAVKGKDMARARLWLEKASRMRPGDTRPWLWLSATTDEIDEKRTFLEKAVAADPSNTAARRGLVLLSEQFDQDRLMLEGESLKKKTSTQPVHSTTQEYTCPSCGAQVIFNNQVSSLICSHCGYSSKVTVHDLTETAEQPIDFILPTTRAHLWAQSQQKLSCQNCGAISLNPPNQLSGQCPYCGSNRTAVSEEQIDLVDPNAILLMQVDENKVNHIINQWLGSGLLVPDNLKKDAANLHIRPAYYPFWTFDGTLEIPWRCEVNMGTNKNPRWIQRSGTEFKFFDDILVSGLSAITINEINTLQPFDLGKLVEFSPEYLAGWGALNYDQTLADASLDAREKVVKDLRSELYTKIEPGHEKRALDYGAGKWSGLTFKHILLPLWVGSYQYRKQTYRLLVNGQTGKVTGGKPRDYIKFALYLVMGFIIVAVALFMLFWLAGLS